MAAVFTSITMTYLAKARVLASSVKRHSPDLTFYLLLAEPAPEWLQSAIEAGDEPFDALLTDGDLDIPNHDGWMFEHEVVEACTALKGAALHHLLNVRAESKVLYLDPDILVLSGLRDLIDALDGSSILLTPHCPDAESELEPIIFNEISSLAHGVYNLGFIGVAADAEGLRFANWWRHRLYHFCHDDIPRGLFTDQRWVDLVPAQFVGVRILRDGRYNAASWNITQRTISGSVPDGLMANGEPLCFYHFSGANSGVPETMYDRFGIDSRAAAELVRFYREECSKAGEDDVANTPWHYGRYADDTPITRAQRRFYRDDPSVQRLVPDPFGRHGDGLLQWITKHGPGLAGVEEMYSDQPEVLQAAAARLRYIESRRAFKLYRRGSGMVARLKRVRMVRR